MQRTFFLFKNNLINQHNFLFSILNDERNNRYSFFLEKGKVINLLSSEDNLKN